MAKVTGLVLVFVLAFGTVACGGDDATPTPVPLTLETATSCAEVMDLFMPIVQGVLDATKDMTAADMMSDEEPEFLADFEEDVDKIRNKSNDLGCEQEELQSLFNERKGSLTAEGPVGELLLQMMDEIEFD